MSPLSSAAAFVPLNVCFSFVIWVLGMPERPEVTVRATPVTSRCRWATDGVATRGTLRAGRCAPGGLPDPNPGSRCPGWLVWLCSPFCCYIVQICHASGINSSKVWAFCYLKTTRGQSADSPSCQCGALTSCWCRGHLLFPWFWREDGQSHCKALINYALPSSGETGEEAGEWKPIYAINC